MHDAPLTLYTNSLNSAGERVRIALALKGLDYEYISVREIGLEAYRKVNPQGLIPALAVNGVIFAQATAILEYLEEMYPTPSLLPEEPVLRATARGFAQHITSEMHAIDVIRVRRFLHEKLHVDQNGLDNWQRHWFALGFSALEELLARRETQWRCCFSDEPGWADLHLVPQVKKGLSRFNLDMSPYPLLLATYKACVDHPAFVAARPENQPDYPGQHDEPQLNADWTEASNPGV